MKTHLRARTFLSLVGAFVLVFSVFGMASPEVIAQGRSAARAGQPAWSTYTGQRFEFTIDYPADWHVRPRRDDLGGYGGAVGFGNLPPGDAGCNASVEVGLHLSEIASDQSLSAWQGLYEEQERRSGLGAFTNVVRDVISTNRWKGLLVRGAVPEGQIQVAKIASGRLVWYVWFICSDCTGEEVGIYQRMVHSLRFGPASPKDLKAAYGEDFQPVPLEASAEVPSPVIPAGADPGGPGPVELGFRLPFSGDKLISQGTACVAGESHTGVLSEAIDYSMTTYTQVKATFNGKVHRILRDDAAKGNVVYINHTASGYVSTYMHLYDFAAGLAVDQTVAKGQVIGRSGCTGSTCGGPHLHFEVRFYDGGPTAWIRTLPGTTWQSGEPRYPCPGRWCIDPPENKHCYYGHAVGP